MTRKTKLVAIQKPKQNRTSKEDSRRVRESRLRKKVRDLSLSNEQLLKLAKLNPPPPEFFKGDEERPW